MHEKFLQFISLRLVVSLALDTTNLFANFFRTPDDTLPKVDIDFVLIVEVAEGGAVVFSFFDFFDGDGVDDDPLFAGVFGAV